MSDVFRLESNDPREVFEARRVAIVEEMDEGWLRKKWILETLEPTPRRLVGYYTANLPSEGGGHFQVDDDVARTTQIWVVSIPHSETNPLWYISLSLKSYLRAARLIAEEQGCDPYEERDYNRMVEIIKGHGLKEKTWGDVLAWMGTKKEILDVVNSIECELHIGGPSYEDLFENDLEEIRIRFNLADSEKMLYTVHVDEP